MKQLDGRSLVALTLAAQLGALAGCASTGPGLPTVPDNLKVPAGQTLKLSVNATGVQIYECRASKNDPTRFEWAFKAPEAQLFDGKGLKIGKHYDGPTWEANDGSKVVGELKAKDSGPDPTAVAWLLLSAKSTKGAGTFGSGVFGNVKSIQRMQTVGGIAPATPCNQTQAGQESRVLYRAAYYFYS